MKKRNKFISTLAAAAMVAVMAGATLPTTALAEGSSGASDGSMIVSKTATLENDGTYTINIQAYATGETVTTTTTKPTDVVLVLDLSGSMDENFDFVKSYEYIEDTSTKIKDCPNATLYHQCPDGTYGTITWTEQGKRGVGTYRYVCDHCKATRKWNSPLWKTLGDADTSWNLYQYKGVTESQNKLDALKNAAKAFIDGVAEKNAKLENDEDKHQVSIVKFASETINDTIGNNKYGTYNYNYTQTVAGMTLVNAESTGTLKTKINELSAGGATAADKGLSLAKNLLADSGERQKVVILFTDGQPTYNNGFEDNVANNAVSIAKELKDEGTTIYTVGLFTGANPADTTTNTNAYLNAVSSNYPSATEYTSLGDGANNGYYKTVSQTQDLTSIFQEISETVGTSKVTLDANSVVKDVMANGLVLTDSSNVTVMEDQYKGRDENGNRIFNNNPTQSSARAEKDLATNVVSVTGFDFKKNYLLDGTEIENNFTNAKQGKKLIITITGVEATDETVQNTPVNTNGEASGIYANNTVEQAAILFPVPTTTLTSKSYVLDYAKPFTVNATEWNASSISHLDKDGMHKISANNNTVDLTNGKAESNNGTLTYTPQTMSWKDYDSFYVFGKIASDETVWGTANNGNVWSKINVIPANNVYYEDDFVTTSTDGGKTGTVGIVYSGKDWETDGTSGGNTANTDSHGEWVPGDSRANDGTYSDGSAHKGSAGATASFSFTGTGVDIYSRTDMTTGTVVAQLKGNNGDGQPVNKLYIVDNYSNDHDGNCNAVPYYQIPTVTFGNLDYGTYTVTITVTTAAAGRSTYYLDGIRVYNPLGNSLDETVKEAYGPTELNATFTEVRSLLSGNGDWSEGTTIGGAVYIDQIEGQSTPVFAVYEKDGPKDEVYLSKNQAIAFAVDDPDATYYIGLKGPQGETSAEISNGNNNSTAQINSASDLYYKVVPYSYTDADAEGKTTYFIMVKNTGENLLSVTKLRVTGPAPAVSEDETSSVTSFSLSAMRSYINTFDTLETVAYTAAPEDAEGSEEAPEVTEPDNTEGETSEIVPPEDVVIENPEPAEPEQPAVSPIRKILNKIFNGFRGLFQR